MGEHPLKEFLVSEAAKKRLLDPDYMHMAQDEGVSGEEILGFGLETMGKFYGAARELFKRKEYLNAADAFLFLATVNGQNLEYWLGLGMATQMLGEFELAIDAYEVAAITELDNPIPYFYLGKCLFAIHDREAARHALEMAIEYADDFPEYAELKMQAKAARQLIEKPPPLPTDLV